MESDIAIRNDNDNMKIRQRVRVVVNDIVVLVVFVTVVFVVFVWVVFVVFIRVVFVVNIKWPASSLTWFWLWSVVHVVWVLFYVVVVPIIGFPSSSSS